MAPSVHEDALKIVTFLLFLTFQQVTARQPPNLLIQKLLGNENNDVSKTYVYLPKQQYYLDDNESSGSSGKSSSSNEKLKQRPDEEAYQLYGILRSNMVDGPLSPSLEEKVSGSKLVLGKALRSRCSQLQGCMDDCQYRRYGQGGCKRKCQKVFDKLDLCEKTTTPRCTTTRCTTTRDPCARGKTMPPRWLLRMLLRNGLEE